MILRRSGYVHLIELGASTLAVHAISQMRVTVTADVARLIRSFEEPCALNVALPKLMAALGVGKAAICACVLMLVDRGILTERSTAVEAADIGRDLGATYGRDPEALLDRYRRSRMEGSHAYWSVPTPHGLDDTTALHRRIDLLLLGDCDVQMEGDFLREEGRRRGIDVRVAASFSGDVDLAAERKHDAVLIGMLQARHAIVLGDPRHHDGDPARVYVDAVEALLQKLRKRTVAPILINGLPEPTLQPLGFADRGLHSHRNRFRRTNLALTELAETYPDVHLVDVAAVLGGAGNDALLDDGLVSFTHFGANGWMLQRPPSERSAVHDQFPDLQSLADRLGGNPYGRETVMARAHMDAVCVVLGVERKKCVIVDLDGVLWPGVLAETGAPFAWAPEVSGPNSFIGLYFGIHEALLALRRRGILLACVSKNDEATVRALWRYGEAYPSHRLLTIDHFVCTRINWSDKARNIESIAEELGFRLDAFAFVDDSPRERERVRQSLPDVALFGDDLFGLRRALLTDPRLQPLRITAEAANRSTLVREQLDRARLRAEINDEETFVASLNVEATTETFSPSIATADVLERVCELMERTTQFNATGATFSREALTHIAGSDEGYVITLRMRDRLADHGLVGVAVVCAGEILNVVMSCRVIGLRGERALLRAVMEKSAGRPLCGRIVATDRNAPVRHLFRDLGFRGDGDSLWYFHEEYPVPA